VIILILELGSPTRHGRVNGDRFCLHVDLPVPVLPSTEHHAMKAHWRSGGTAPLIL